MNSNRIPTQAQRWQSLFNLEQRTRNLRDHILRQEFEDQYGNTIETRRLDSEQLDADNGTGFETEIWFRDGSNILTKTMYLVDSTDAIVFEKRPYDL